ncbi:YIP1 family protein [soil metagenome]
MTASSSITEMLAQSQEVLTKPSVATFERFEDRGTLADALIYVAVAAAITGVFGLTGGLGGFVGNILATLLGFFAFTFLVYWLGRQRGGTGTLNQVAYSFALFWAPLSVLFGVLSFVLLITIIGILALPLVAIAALVANVYFAYLAVQSSLNLQGGGTVWVVLLLAAIGTFAVNMLVAAMVR